MSQPKKKDKVTSVMKKVSMPVEKERGIIFNSNIGILVTVCFILLMVQVGKFDQTFQISIHVFHEPLIS